MVSSDDNEYTPAAAMPDYLIRHTTMRQLQVFEAIVRLGSFTRAAEELFLTQPTVAYEMYFPEVWGRSDGGSFAIQGE